MAGQYFDRPNSQVVAKQLGTAHSDDGRMVTTMSSFLSPSIRYFWQLVRVRVWFPLFDIYQQFSSALRGGNPRFSFLGLPVSGRRTPLPKISLAVNQAHAYWNEFWNIYGISLQILIPLITALFYIWYFVSMMREPASSYPITMNTRSLEEEDLDSNKAYGSYRKLLQPTMTQMVIVLSATGTMATILLYNQIVLPLPDLVAGSNVLKAVRNEAKAHTSHTTKPNKTKGQREHIDLPLSEQYKLITGENRFRLICKVLLVRVVEGVLLCVWMPRTAFSCRFIGHCPEGLSLQDLSKILYPVGITSPFRMDARYPSEMQYLTSDLGAAVMTLLSLLVTTIAMLLVQATTLNRSYLGIMGYVAGGWTVVDKSDLSTSGPTPSQWDPRRRYKKGDLISQSFPGLGTPTIYKATSNSPEGRPMDLFLRATHDLFRNEVGHPATSTIIAYASAAQLFVSLLVVLLVLCYQALDYSYGSLLWTLAANVVATYGILLTAMPAYQELELLAHEISE